MTVHVVTDSTSDIPQGTAAAMGITVVPLTVSFGEEHFQDGIDLGPEDFYKRLQGSRVVPTTSQPSPERFAGVYRGLLRGPDDRVVSLHLSGKWSGTLQSASIAADECGDRVDVVDSGTVSIGMQLAVRALVRERDRGMDPDEIVHNATARRDRVAVAVLLDTLTYLHRGGRIGRAQAFLGGVLHVKPVLYVADGEAHPHARARSRQQGIAKLVELVREQGALEMVSVGRTDDEQGFGVLREAVVREYGELDVVEGHVGPVVGTYAGPGALGIGWLRAGSSV